MVPTSAQSALLRNIAQILPLKEQGKSRIYKIEKKNRKRCSLSCHLICLILYIQRNLIGILRHVSVTVMLTQAACTLVSL